MSRITLHDTLMDIMVKLAEGNPGACMTISEVMKSAGDIDPQNALGPMGVLLWLDDLEIYGTDIYVLFNDKCGRDMTKFCLLHRAYQYGLIDENRLKNAAGDQMRRPDFDFSDAEWATFRGRIAEELKEFVL